MEQRTVSGTRERSRNALDEQAGSASTSTAITNQPCAAQTIRPLRPRDTIHTFCTSARPTRATTETARYGHERPTLRHLAWIKHDIAIAKVDREKSGEDEEEVVGLIMLMPGDPPGWEPQIPRLSRCGSREDSYRPPRVIDHGSPCGRTVSQAVARSNPRSRQTQNRSTCTDSTRGRSRCRHPG